MAYGLTIPLPRVPLLHRLMVLVGMRQRDDRVTWRVAWRETGETWHHELISVPPYERSMTIPHRAKYPDSIIEFAFRWAPND